MCAMGKLVKNCSYTSFNLLVHSESSAGKDYVTKNVLKIIPQSTVYSRTRISPTVLNYWKPYQKAGLGGWDGSILYLPDISDSVLNSDALKLMCSDGSHITITENGEARDIEIKGKPVIFSTTANATPNDEIMNRFSILGLDESEEQTRRIMERQAERMVEGLTDKYDPEIVEALNHLERHKVKIPFAKEIVKAFPSKKIGERRNFERFFDFIKSIACVYQYQREFDGDFLVAELDDYNKARDIFMGIHRGVSSIPLNARQKQIVEVLKKETEMIGLSDIHKLLGKYIALKNLRPHIESLVNLKIIEKQFGKDTFGRELIVYKLSEEYLNFKPIILPIGEDLKVDSNDGSTNNYTNTTYDGYEI